MELFVTSPRGRCYARERVVGEGVICEARLHPESGVDGMRDVGGGMGMNLSGVTVLVIYTRAWARGRAFEVPSEASVFTMRSTSGKWTRDRPCLATLWRSEYRELLCLALGD